MIQFVGQIETKALGWIFRAFDTKNYYAMKIEAIRPGGVTGIVVGKMRRKYGRISVDFRTAQKQSVSDDRDW